MGSKNIVYTIARPIAVLLLVLSQLLSCSTWLNSDVIYEDEVFKVTEAPKYSGDEIIIQNEWIPTTLNELFADEGDIIVKGYVRKLTEIKQEYTQNETHQEIYATLCDFEVTDIYSDKLDDSKSNKMNDNRKITLIIQQSSYYLTPDFQSVDVGDEYIFFAKSCDRIDSECDAPIKFAKFADYAIRRPETMLKKTGDYYVIHDIFADEVPMADSDIETLQSHFTVESKLLESYIADKSDSITAANN